MSRGTYRVDLIFGDRGTVAHGQVTIYFEGHRGRGLDGRRAGRGASLSRGCLRRSVDAAVAGRSGRGDEARLTALRVTTDGYVRPAASDAWWPMFPEIPGTWFSSQPRIPMASLFTG